MTIFDPVEDDPTTWFPANPETGLLVAALAGARDVGRSLDGLGNDPLTDRRGLAMLATPALSLLDNTVFLQKATSRKDISTWPVRDANLLIELGRRLRKLRNGPLTKLRDKLSAHHDASALGTGLVSVAQHGPLVLEAVPQSLCVLVLLLNHQDVFSWSRQATPDRSDLVQIFQPGALGAPTFRQEAGNIVELVKFTLRSDPKHEAQDVVSDTLDRYNRVAARAKLPLVDLTRSNEPIRDKGTG